MILIAIVGDYDRTSRLHQGNHLTIPGKCAHIHRNPRPNPARHFRKPLRCRAYDRANPGLPANISPCLVNPNFRAVSNSVETECDSICSSRAAIAKATSPHLPAGRDHWGRNRLRAVLRDWLHRPEADPRAASFALLHHSLHSRFSHCTVHKSLLTASPRTSQKTFSNRKDDTQRAFKVHQCSLVKSLSPLFLNSLARRDTTMKTGDHVVQTILASLDPQQSSQAQAARLKDEANQFFNGSSSPSFPTPCRRGLRHRDRALLQGDRTRPAHRGLLRQSQYGVPQTRTLRLRVVRRERVPRAGPDVHQRVLPSRDGEHGAREVQTRVEGLRHGSSLMGDCNSWIRCVK